MNTEKVIPPQGSRRHKIIFRANFNPSYNKGGDLDKTLSMQLGGMGLFGENE